MTIAYRRLRDPLRHSAECAKQCVADCSVYALDAALNEPVLASEIEAAKQEEDRFKALAAEARG